MSDTVILEKGKPILYRLARRAYTRRTIVQPQLDLVIKGLCKKFEQTTKY